MEQKQLEGDMRGFCTLTKIGLIFCAFFAVLSVILHCVGIVNLSVEPYLQLLILLCLGAIYFLYAFLYVRKYHYTITEKEITVVSLFGNKVLAIEQGMTYSQKRLNPSWFLITVCCNNEKISIRTKNEKEVLSFLSEYGTEV